MKCLSLPLALCLVLGAPIAARADAITSDPAELQRARAELRDAQQQLGELSGRIAELSLRITRDDIAQALERPAFDRPVIGVVLQPHADDGVAVAVVTPKSPAERAGLRGGDQLLAIDGEALRGTDPEQRLSIAMERLRELEDGQAVRLDYRRQGKDLQATLSAERLPGLTWWRDHALDPDALRAQLAPLIAMRGLLDIERIAPTAPCADGAADCAPMRIAEAMRWRSLRMVAVDAELGRYFKTERGVLVLSGATSPLQGLQSGDVLLSVDTHTVDEPGDVLRALRGVARDAQVPVSLRRDGRTLDLKLQPAALPDFPPLPPIPPFPPTPPVAPKAPSPATAPVPPTPPAAPAAPAAPPGVLRQVLS